MPLPLPGRLSVLSDLFIYYLVSYLIFCILFCYLYHAHGFREFFVGRHHGGRGEDRLRELSTTGVWVQGRGYSQEGWQLALREGKTLIEKKLKPKTSVPARRGTYHTGQWKPCDIPALVVGRKAYPARNPRTGSTCEAETRQVTEGQVVVHDGKATTAKQLAIPQYPRLVGRDPPLDADPANNLATPPN